MRYFILIQFIFFLTVSLSFAEQDYVSKDLKWHYFNSDGILRPRPPIKIDTVKKVIDGTTLNLVNYGEVCLIGVDDSSTKKDTADFLKTLIDENQEIGLEFDVKEKNEKGQWLAYVYVPIYPTALWLIYDGYIHNEQLPYINPSDHFDSPEGVKGIQAERLNLNAYLIHYGFAKPKKGPPNVKYAELFEKLFEEAKEKGRGLWQPSVFDNKVHVSDEDQVCVNDEDCIKVEVDCTAYACECGMPVNKKYQKKYQEAVEKCREEYVDDVGSVTQCDFMCVEGYDSLCINNKCQSRKISFPIKDKRLLRAEDQKWVKEQLNRALKREGIEGKIINFSMPSEELQRYWPLVTYEVCVKERSSQEDCYLVHYDYDKWFVNEKAKDVRRGLRKEESFLDPIFCTKDAKLCPDGSYVGRIPPDCEFQACLE